MEHGDIGPKSKLLQWTGIPSDGLCSIQFLGQAPTKSGFHEGWWGKSWIIPYPCWLGISPNGVYTGNIAATWVLRSPEALPPFKGHRCQPGTIHWDARSPLQPSCWFSSTKWITRFFLTRLIYWIMTLIFDGLSISFNHLFQCPFSRLFHHNFSLALT